MPDVSLYQKSIGLFDQKNDEEIAALPPCLFCDGCYQKSCNINLIVLRSQSGWINWRWKGPTKLPKKFPHGKKWFVVVLGVSVVAIVTAAIAIRYLPCTVCWPSQYWQGMARKTKLPTQHRIWPWQLVIKLRKKWLSRGKKDCLCWFWEFPWLQLSRLLLLYHQRLPLPFLLMLTTPRF